MNFIVYFETSKLGENVISIDSQQIGIKALDYIRAKLGINIPADRVIGDIKRYVEGYCCIYLTEQEARQSGLFLNRHSLTVYVPHQFLNKFCYKAIKVEKNNETGEVLKASLYWKVNPKAIKQAWLRMGCPLKWNFVPKKD